LGLAIHWVQQALILAYVDNCPLTPVKMGRNSVVDCGVGIPKKSDMALQ
jgi:hypothetical protein